MYNYPTDSRLPGSQQRMLCFNLAVQNSELYRNCCWFVLANSICCPDTGSVSDLPQRLMFLDQLPLFCSLDWSVDLKLQWSSAESGLGKQFQKYPPYSEEPGISLEKENIRGLS